MRARRVPLWLELLIGLAAAIAGFLLAYCL